MCERQKLPLVKDSEPLRLFVDPKAKPIAIRTPAQIPLAWQTSVREGLEQDVRLGVLERVPVKPPDKWCFRMHIVPKPDGSPRRVVDYGNLNKHAPCHLIIWKLRGPLGHSSCNSPEHGQDSP